ncbi:MAG: hypothetical protein CL666_04710 [Balneola sp.]|nr:hypothetical protein [Balneola sp.]|tara:strand:+ start:47324 stop:47620 length:297 start_codon:yes stop_codon:yes gene_type:complete
MIQLVKQKYQWLKRSLPSVKQVAKILALVFNMLPGLLAYAFEVICFVISAVLVIHSVAQMMDGQVLYAFMIAALAASMIAMAILSDYYATDRPNKGGE